MHHVTDAPRVLLWSLGQQEVCLLRWLQGKEEEGEIRGSSAPVSGGMDCSDPNPAALSDEKEEEIRGRE